jgi:glyoxylase-like metal-dependent hydrolase (beta-lactamase superfamily II)
MMSILEVFEGTKLDSVKADIPMTNFYDLCDYGVDGFVMHTPGHSEASVSIILDNGEAFIGDMIRGSGEGAFGPGMFYEDKEILVKSLENVSRWSPETIYLSHGGHISGDILNQTIESLRSGP